MKIFTVITSTDAGLSADHFLRAEDLIFHVTVTLLDQYEEDGWNEEVRAKVLQKIGPVQQAESLSQWLTDYFDQAMAEIGDISDELKVQEDQINSPDLMTMPQIRHAVESEFNDGSSEGLIHRLVELLHPSE